ncbi:hypothetical protein [Rubritalea halochordaticola]
MKDWRRKHPPLPPRKRPMEPIPDPVKEAETPEEKTPVIATVPRGDLEISPALDHFIEHAKLGAASYIQLAKQLEDDKLSDFALLAWERVLDSTQPNSEELSVAALANLRLRLEAPIWNADPENNIDIVLHLSVPEAVKKEVSGLVEQMTTEMRNASSYQIAPQILLTTAEQRPGFPPPPMAIWLSGTGKDAPETPKLTTPLIPALGTEQSLAPPELEAKVYSALYRSITSRLKQQTQLTPPADLTAGTSPRQALTSHITRLHWHKLAHTLNGDFKPKARKKDKEEDQEEQ